MIFFACLRKGYNLPAVFSPSELPGRENPFISHALDYQEVLTASTECNISEEISKAKDASENGRKMETLFRLAKN